MAFPISANTYIDKCKSLSDEMTSTSALPDTTATQRNLAQARWLDTCQKYVRLFAPMRDSFARIAWIEAFHEQNKDPVHPGWDTRTRKERVTSSGTIETHLTAIQQEMRGEISRMMVISQHDDFKTARKIWEYLQNDFKDSLRNTFTGEVANIDERAIREEWIQVIMDGVAEVHTKYLAALSAPAPTHMQAEITVTERVQKPVPAGVPGAGALVWHDIEVPITIDISTSSAFVKWTETLFAQKTHSFGMHGYVGLSIVIDELDLERFIVSIGQAIDEIMRYYASTMANMGKIILIILAVLALIWAGWKLIFESDNAANIIKSLIQITVTAVVFLYLLGEEKITVHIPQYDPIDGTPVMDASGSHQTTPAEQTSVRFMVFVTWMFEGIVALPASSLCKDLQVNLTSSGGTHTTDGGFVFTTIDPQEITRDGFCDVINSEEGYAHAQSLAGAAGFFTYGLKQGFNMVSAASRGFSYTQMGTNNASFAGFGSGAYGLVYVAVGTFIGGIFAMAIIVLWLLVCFTLLLLWIEGFMIVVVGIFMLGFGAHEWTQDKAKSYIFYCVGWVLRYMVVVFTIHALHFAFQFGFSEVEMLKKFLAGEGQNFVSLFIIGTFKVIEPIAIVMVMTSVSNRIGQFFGNTSSVANQMTGMMQSVGTKAIGTAGAVVGAGMAAQAVQLAKTGTKMGGAALWGGVKGGVQGFRGGSGSSFWGNVKKGATDNLDAFKNKDFMDKRTG